MSKNNPYLQFEIAAIKTTLPIYSLAWQINQSFKMDFHLSHNWEKQSEQNKISLHNHCYGYFEDVELHWHLLENKGSNAYFLQTKPLFDYFFICNGDDIFKYFSMAVLEIKKNNAIENIFLIENKKIKNADSILNNLINTKEFQNDINVQI